MKKNLLIALLAITAIVCCMTGFAACNTDKSYSKGLEYSAIEENGEVIAYSVVGKGSARNKEIIIPSTYKDKPVTAIGEGAFQEFTLSFKRLERITIPDSVTTIGDSAFQDCRKLNYVTIPDSVTTIGNSAFQGCGNLYNVTIPDGVTTIGWRAFNDCYRLTSITVGGNITSIGNYAFRGCDIKNVYFTGDLTDWCKISGLFDIGIENLFINGEKLKGDLVIPEGVTSIGDFAFYGKDITSVTIPDSVTSIGDEAFCNCGNLTSVIIPDSVTSIGRQAFSECGSLTNIAIPDSITYIGSEAFSGCKKLVYNEYDNGYYLGNESNPCLVFLKVKDNSITNFELNSGSKVIYGFAFNGCKSLTNIALPNGVTQIGSNAFGECDSLTSIAIPESVTYIGQGVFAGCSSLISITIPDGVTKIEYGTFSRCTSLTSVTLPDSVTSIGYIAFSSCESLKSITFKGTKEQWQAIENATDWNYTDINCVIHCTDGDIEKSN